MRTIEKVSNKIWINRVKIIIDSYKRMLNNLIDAAKYNMLNQRMLLKRIIIHSVKTKIIYFWNKKKMSFNMIRNRIAQMLRLSKYQIIYNQINRLKKIMLILLIFIEERTLSRFPQIFVKIQILENGLNGYLKE